MEKPTKESEDPEAVPNEFAAGGWRLIETIDYTGGVTWYLPFESCPIARPRAIDPLILRESQR